MARLDPGAFWEFSLAYYANGAVSPACLSLQNRRGADVNILLLCCWLATLGYSIDEAGLKAAIAAIEAWRRDVLEPLRAARRAVAEGFPELAKSDRKSIRHTMLSAELDCERIAQEKLAAAVADRVTPQDSRIPRQIAAAALETYCGLVIGTPEERDATDLTAILDPL